jgi:hypothetical protein
MGYRPPPVTGGALTTHLISTQVGLIAIQHIKFIAKKNDRSLAHPVL